MSFLAAVGAVVVGSVTTIVLLTCALLGWTWVNQRVKHDVVEPALPLLLLIVLGLNGWILNATTGDAGVFGLVLGLVAWGTFIYHYLKGRRPKSAWEEFTAWVKRKQ